MNKQIAIISGETLSWISSHLALVAPAKGTVGRDLDRICKEIWPNIDVNLYLTRTSYKPELGSGSSKVMQLETVDDVSALIDRLVENPLTKVVFFPVSIVDFDGYIPHLQTTPESRGKQGARISSRKNPVLQMTLTATEKIISKIRATRKDIFLVGFKHTSRLSEDEQYLEGLHLCKSSHCNLVLANDEGSRLNMVITPEEARYHVTTNREWALRGLVEMTKLRSNLTFTRSTVVAGEPVPWSSELVPDSLRKVVDHCIQEGAYKPFRGSTVGHFAVKVGETTFLTSQRRTDFNDLDKIGLVKIETDGPDSVIAYGSKPSVGGQSQRIVFNDHPDLDCIVHFHSPIKLNSPVPQVSQREVECGSHQCGNQTSKGLKQFGNLHAVYLTNHGPNIVFNRSINPQEVIDFIDENFDLSQKTGGLVYDI